MTAPLILCELLKIRRTLSAIGPAGASPVEVRARAVDTRPVSTPGQVLRAVAAIAVAACALSLAGAPPASATVPTLPMSKARGVVAKAAKDVRSDMARDGADRSGVASCERKSRSRVSCYLHVSGYDAAADFEWTCLLEVVVEVKAQRNGRSRLRSRYGEAACA